MQAEQKTGFNLLDLSMCLSFPLDELDLAMARLIAADAGAAEDSKLKEEVEVLKKICQKKKAKQSSRS